MDKIAFLFSGQGSQYVGMARDLYNNYETVRNTLDTADGILNENLTGIIFEGPEDKLKLTENTQPAILAVSIAIMNLLVKEGIEPDGALGLSLGEYSALTASGILSYEDALPLVRKRGRFMQEAVPEGNGSMAAIIGLSREDVLSLVQEASIAGIVEAVNFNCPGQIAVAGEVAAVNKAVELAKEKGATKSVMLQVSAPFHSSMLKAAGDKLNIELNKLKFNKGKIPVLANLDCEYYGDNRERVIDKLTKQVYNAVLFEDCIKKMINDGYNVFVEAGPGRALNSFVKRIDKNVRLLNVEDIKSLEKTISSLK
ncbi:malonyl CoA-acyl carrier protein transacylase [Oxobacter pfennigii]|uniref:Malonyl CoA-acyl carrier protein transacylase n=1 Tax=Oxobacter pfennigii TaxID=36849 RepID=A0A0P9AF12_9CLOT|nr:ACP S-malonyltransferase [Oxobacter pfennigii]KPU43946.1 malonyl CoA-acyl carrier protein transacylase [Oxobacter pfennigii]